MQLYAFDQSKQPIFANQARKQVDYCCIECESIVRLRGGLHRQKHFYHVEPNRRCTLHGKGMVHLQVQLFLLDVLKEGGCQLEVRFPEIKRIADVVWKSEKIIFEIQCSPITAEEVLARNQDYSRLGWQVVWILHDQRYNHHRLTAAEVALREHPYYFTNIKTQGKGMIYDQFDLFSKGVRIHKLRKLPIDITKKNPMNRSIQAAKSLQLVKERINSWPLFFQGDLVEVSFSTVGLETVQYMKDAQEIEGLWHKSIQSNRPRTLLSWIRWGWTQWVLRSYSLFIQIMLERMCR